MLPRRSVLNTQLSVNYCRPQWPTIRFDLVRNNTHEEGGIIRDSVVVATCFRTRLLPMKPQHSLSDSATLAVVQSCTDSENNRTILLDIILLVSLCCVVIVRQKCIFIQNETKSWKVAPPKFRSLSANKEEKRGFEGEIYFCSLVNCDDDKAFAIIL